MLKIAHDKTNMDWGFFLLMKIMTTLVKGLTVCIPRWLTRKEYRSLILHSLINLFGR
jgi:hypothetical protein